MKWVMSRMDECYDWGRRGCSESTPISLLPEEGCVVKHRTRRVLPAKKVREAADTKKKAS